MIKRHKPNEYPGIDDVCSSDDVAELEERIKELEFNQTQWISVEDRFPEVDLLVLCYIPGIGEMTCFLDMDKRFKYMLADGYICTPTHWMLIPPLKEQI